MDKKGIKSFSIETLGNLDFLIEDADVQYEGFYSAHRNSSQLKHLEMFKYPCRINAFITILCVKGSSKIILNMKKYTISENCLFLSTPNNIIQVEHWGDCEIYITALNDDFAKQIKIDYRKALSIYLGMNRLPLIRLSKAESDILTDIFLDLSHDIISFRGSEYSSEIVNTSLNLAAFKFFSLTGKYRAAVQDYSGKGESRKEDHYNKFIQLVERNFKKERNIGFYASQICITPKYLTSLVKRLTGRSAADWINGLVILEAKHLLKYSAMNIQEVADYLNFPNQSFFTQYFRRHTGLTPTSYRRKT
jgi:AraC family transcriptional regulator, transcriptional activator of pobA